MRFSQAIRLACVCALVCSALTPLRASGLSDDARAALIRAPLADEGAGARSEPVEPAVKAATPRDEAQSATAAKKRPNLFLRIISAPFRGLAKLFGGGDKGDRDARAKAKQKKEKQSATATRPAGAGPDAAPAERQTAVTAATSVAAALPAPSQPAALAEAAARSVRSGEKALSVPPTSAATTASATTPPAAVPLPPAAPQAEETTDYEPRRFTPFIEGVPGDPLSQGRALLANGYTNEAVAELSVAAVTGPDLVEANNLLGLAYDRRGQHKQAREFYERALSVAPRNAQVMNNLGHSLYLDDRYADALARLKDAARLDPADTRVAGNLALVYGRLGKYDDAFKQFKRAGGEFYARTSTAALLAAAGRDREAIRHYEAARKLNPAAPDVLRQLITLYVRTGQRDKAEAAQRALEGAPAKSGASASS